MDIKLTPEQIEALRRVDTCALANAIEVFGVRSHNEGFAGPDRESYPGRAARMREIDQEIIAVCRSPEFSVEKLRAAIEKYKSNSPDPQTSEVGDEIKN